MNPLSTTTTTFQQLLDLKHSEHFEGLRKSKSLAVVRMLNCALIRRRMKQNKKMNNNEPVFEIIPKPSKRKRPRQSLLLTSPWLSELGLSFSIWLLSRCKRRLSHNLHIQPTRPTSPQMNTVTTTTRTPFKYPLFKAYMSLVIPLTSRMAADAAELRPFFCSRHHLLQVALHRCHIYGKCAAPQCLFNLNPSAFQVTSCNSFRMQCGHQSMRCMGRHQLLRARLPTTAQRFKIRRIGKLKRMSCSRTLLCRAPIPTMAQR